MGNSDEITFKNDDGKFIITDEDGYKKYVCDRFNETGDEHKFFKSLHFLTKALGIAKIEERTGMRRDNLRRFLDGKHSPMYSNIAKIMAALDLKFEAKVKENKRSENNEI